MAKVRKIQRNPENCNFYLIDACFLANKYIPPQIVTNLRERHRIERSLDWWKEINKQLKNGRAIVYVPDICIAESFKVLAKKYYEDNYFPSPASYKQSRDKFSKDIRISSKKLKSSKRIVKFHDISTCRDIIIAVDRFLETSFKYGLKVSTVDLIILAIAKYLIDFYHIPQDSLHIVTLDNNLWRASRNVSYIPAAYNPNRPSNFARQVFA